MPLTHVDVARLVQGAGREPSSFAVWLAPDEVDIEPDAFVDVTAGKRLLALAQIRETAREARGADCIFWRGDEGCSVYPHRPLACRAYPFEPERAEGDELRVHLRVHPDVMCDESTGVREFMSDTVEPLDDEPTRRVLSLHAERERELSEYFARVSAWNKRQRRRRLAGKRPESAEAFLATLLEEQA